jgi:guanylate kinase
MLFLVSGPSGVGKSTLIKLLLERRSNLHQVVSHTSRSPRPGENDGVHYHFISKATFQEMLGQNLFLTHAEIYGNFYGVLTSSVTSLLQTGSVILDMHPTWQFRVKEKIAESLSVFIMPPSTDVLRARLTGRGDPDETVAKRMSEVPFVEKFAIEYDYVVLNEQHKVSEAADKFFDIVDANPRRASFTPFSAALQTRIFADNAIVEPFTYVEKMKQRKSHLFPSTDTLKAAEVIGWTNISFRLTNALVDYVLRVPRPGAGHVAHYRAEMENSELAYQAGVAPEMPYFDADSGLKLTRYVPNQGTLTIDVIKENEGYISQVAKKLSAIHSMSTPFANQANPKEDMHTQFNLLPNKEEYEQLPALFAKAVKTFSLLAGSLPTIMPCHMDPTPYNILRSGPDDIVMVDWEHSGQYDFCWDLANFSTQAALSPEQEKRFLIDYRNNIHLLRDRSPMHLVHSQPEDKFIFYCQQRMNLYKPLIETMLCVFILYQKNVVLNKTVPQEQLVHYSLLRYNNAIRLFASAEYAAAWQHLAASVSAQLVASRASQEEKPAAEISEKIERQFSASC